MHDIGKWLISAVGASALVASVLTNAAASRPPAQHLAAISNAQIRGNTNVTGTLHVGGNINVKKNSYFRGKAEVDKGLLVKRGLKSDALSVTGAFSADSGSIANNLSVGKGLSADSITGTTLTVQGASTFGGTLTASGLVKGNGVDAGSGGFTTTGNLSAAGANVSSINDTGSLTAASARLGGLSVTGAVDFSQAQVTGLNLSNLNLNGISLTTANIGAPTLTSPPLTIQENLGSAQVGVDQNNNLLLGKVITSGNLTVGGNLSVTGTSNLSVSSLVAPNASGTTTPGQFTITGNPIVLTGAVQATSTLSVNGNTTIGGNGDLLLPYTAATTSTPLSSPHITAANNTDIAGQITVTATAATGSTGPFAATYSFHKNYTTFPVVTLTLADDPTPANNDMPKYWVSPVGSAGAYTGFTVHYMPAGTVAVGTTYTALFNYHVIGA